MIPLCWLQLTKEKEYLSFYEENAINGWFLLASRIGEVVVRLPECFDRIS